MTYIFKSQATANLTMLDKPAKQILELIGKNPGAPGIINVDEIPGAIDALQQAVNAEKNRGRPPEADGDDAGEENSNENERSISLEQRTWPFIEMLKAALLAEKPVVWGV